MINENVRSLSDKQHHIFDIVHKWSKYYIKNLNLWVLKKIAPFYIFLTGGGFLDISHLTKTIHMSLTKTLMYKRRSQEKTRILSLAPTGVAAINTEGSIAQQTFRIANFDNR